MFNTNGTGYIIYRVRYKNDVGTPCSQCVKLFKTVDTKTLDRLHTYEFHPEYEGMQSNTIKVFSAQPSVARVIIVVNALNGSQQEKRSLLAGVVGYLPTESSGSSTELW